MESTKVMRGLVIAIIAVLFLLGLALFAFAEDAKKPDPKADMEKQVQALQADLQAKAQVLQANQGWQLLQERKARLELEMELNNARMSEMAKPLQEIQVKLQEIQKKLKDLSPGDATVPPAKK